MVCTKAFKDALRPNPSNRAIIVNSTNYEDIYLDGNFGGLWLEPLLASVLFARYLNLLTRR